jgi:hypothetical protein
MDTALQVYSLALERGVAPGREWLVYTHSPVATSPLALRVRVPGGPEIATVSTRSGCFTLVREADPRPTRIGC